ncbi:MAG TPA: ABC transporter, partial [Acidimicrobiia bacterium]|nr:ABC transporter [Acidimicrobiia bacterium]
MAEPLEIQPVPDAGKPIGEHKSRTRDVLETLLKNRLSVVGLVILALFVVAGVFGDALAPYGINEVNIADRLQGPSGAHIFGTDELGRDVFTRVLVAARSSMMVGFVAVGISLGAGVPIGLVAGCYVRWADAFLMRL